MRKITYLSLFFLIFLSVSTPAYAYLDPGTGSVMLQGLLAAIAGVGAATKLYWQRIKAFFSRSKNKKSKSDKDESAT